jgi:ATP-dependent helicase HrpA
VTDVPPTHVEFPEDLPISSRVRDIATAIAEHPVVIVAGETGSGKTTQLPKICLAMGRGLEARIGVTEPRRIAATSVAARVANELRVELGREVGFQIRFSDKTSRATYVKFMTDGILLAEIQGDPMLRAYDTLIIDEAHERNQNVDFLLGYLSRLLPKRPDLRVIISSATLDPARFSAFFNHAPILEVSGRAYPVEVIYRPPQKDEGDLADVVANTVEEITEIDPREDILIFLPGEREIRETMVSLEAHGLPNTVLLPLYGRLAQAEQARAFVPLRERRIVLATNVAETSLTIPGIVYVVDTGLARVNRYDARTGVTRLLVEPVSRASADQRKGRAGRTRSGVCFRLFDEQDYLGRLAFTDPEILRVGLAGTILQMKTMGLGAIETFPFVDPPPKRAIDEGYRVLEEIAALDGDGELTEIGKKIARLPVDPRIGRMVLGGEQEGALREVVILAAALGIQDPRERPLTAQDRADQAHKPFRDEASDFASLLKIWSFFEDAQRTRTQNQVKKLCQDRFLSYLRMREWTDIHGQLSRVVREMGMALDDAKTGTSTSGDAIHRALLPGLLSRIGMWNDEHRMYVGARQTRFALHPSSGLAKKPPPWVMAAELVETSRLFARTVARIDPAWLEVAGGALCRRSYGDPHWEQRPAEVKAKENVTLYGLPVARGRSVHYGPIDPRACRRLFLIHALVRHEYAPPGGRGLLPPFMRHNMAMFEEVRRLRDKARKSGMLADDEAVALFFEKRVPDEVYSGKTFEAWRSEAEAKDAHVLHLGLDDVLLDEAHDLTPERFPDQIVVCGVPLSLSYRFDPGEDDDGVTVTVPVALLPALDPAALEWTIPGWYEEKVRLLLSSLPKAFRKALQPLNELSETIARALVASYEVPMLPALARAVSDLTGMRVPASAFEPRDLPPHLSFWFRVVDQGATLAQGRDLGVLKDRLSPRCREVWAALPKPTWAREGLTTWSFGALPERVAVEVAGHPVFAYPGLADLGSGVALRPFSSAAGAEQASRAGVLRLFLLALGTTASRVEQQFPARAGSALGALGALGEGSGDALRKRLAERALDEALFGSEPEGPPRDQAAFAAQVERGRRRLPAIIAELSKHAEEIAQEATQVRATLRAMNGKPGVPRASVDDIERQLAHLLGPGLWRLKAERLAQLPRYLRAIRVRLDRLPNGPQKDQGKAAQVLPLWSDYLAKREALRARGVAEEELEAFRWLIEEYRVSIFAPEVRAAVTVSSQRLTEQWRLLVE